jgi:vacuole morphology and inheritance protein 14
VADPEISVKNGADLLDRLLKDVVAECAELSSGKAVEEHTLTATASTSAKQSSHMDRVQDPLREEVTNFTLDHFIPLLSERMYAVNPFTRSFLVSWLSVLNALPDLELLSFLPDILDGLLSFVGDSNVNVRAATTNVLGEFLREIRERSAVGRAHDAAESSTEKVPGAQRRSLPTQHRKLLEILLPRARSQSSEEAQNIVLGILSLLLNI